ncbi:unnamed protein product [Moneuplotes crassus]|uniref:Uncharacterized protein n=1 Tax=Euplotes crassus TaxID=5936 RepID=A0AAD1Y193_EUPCR|nr:unnamed protein product [Moneuplotes crassus]
MESLPSIDSSEKKFLDFLIRFVCSTAPKHLFTNLDKISKHMLDKMEPLDDENLYRKQYGNLKECVLAGEGIMQVFKLDGTSFRLQKHDHLIACNDAGLISDDVWEEYLAAYDIYMDNFLKIVKRTKNNICKKCDKRYHTSAGKDCPEGDNCEPSYDFELDEDVLKCKIE